MDLQHALVGYLTSLQGKECWGFIAGAGSGSMVTFDFGGRVPRRKPALNPNLTDEQRNFIGEITLFIQDAAWRIDSENGVLCGSTTWNDLAGPFGDGLRKIVGCRVQGIAVSRPGMDLSIEFDKGLRLKVFCNQTNAEDDGVNYSLHLNTKVYVVGINSSVTIETLNQ